MNLALIGHVQSVRLLQRPLFMRIDVHATLDTFLAHIGPAVARHPFAFTLGTLVLSEATFFSLGTASDPRPSAVPVIEKPRHVSR